MDDGCGVDGVIGRVGDIDVLLGAGADGDIDVLLDVGVDKDVLILCLRTSEYDLGILDLLRDMPSSSLAMLAFTPGVLALEGVGDAVAVLGPS